MSGGRAVLAVDFGSVRIGLAISESPELPALPLCTIEHENRDRDIERIVDVARTRGAGTIVVGYPLKLDGSVGPAAAKIEKLAAELRARFDGEVVRMDERMTSAAANAKLRGGELKPSRRRAIVDRLAAVEILETYLAGTRRRA